MINSENVKYFDRILSHILSTATKQLKLKELTDLCDQDRDLALVIAKEFKERDLVLIAEAKMEYAILLKRNGVAATFFKNGGFTAEFERQQAALRPPKTRDEKIKDFLEQIQDNGGRYLPIEEESREVYRMWNTLLKVDLLERDGIWLVLSDEAVDMLDSGETYSDYISRKNTPPPPTINVNGNYIGGSNYNSPLTATNIVGSNNVTGNIVAAVTKEEGKRPLLERLNWGAGIVGVCWAIWEFIVKNFIN
ncbi:hypothetical protein GCM10027443_06580 [Pontibacter brevis]